MASSDRVINFADLVGGEFDFYGCAGQCFNLDGLAYEVIEEDDSLLGSYLDHVEVSEESRAGFDLPIARIVIEDDCYRTYTLTDLHDGHEWLKFGTEYRRDERDRVVGQSFVFEYSPKALINTDGQ